MVKVLEDKYIVWLIIHSFHNHRTTKKAGGAAMYEYLIRHNIIEYNPVQIRENFKQALKNNKHYMRLMSEELLKKSAIVVNETKSLCVDDFFIDLKINGGRIEDFFFDIPYYVMNK